MDTRTHKTVTASTDAQRAALASPLRLEILRLFSGADSLAIADMAVRLGRPAASLYYHVGILERAGMLRPAGTRPKGKRFETLYEPTGHRVELQVPSGDGNAAEQASRTMAAAFRMAERDFAAALERPDLDREGDRRNCVALRAHLSASPRLLARLNKHLQAIEKLLAAEAARDHRPDPDDQHLSLTLALLPLRGRRPVQPAPEDKDP